VPENVKLVIEDIEVVENDIPFVGYHCLVSKKIIGNHFDGNVGWHCNRNEPYGASYYYKPLEDLELLSPLFTTMSR
jgi:hypothetical protein